ncbi:MFS transporter [Polyangium jinanense]|uniref:MFS transporter n=1 Tax=Polyangium jinanense TaxID=2829994 RepID=A0A9X3XAC6_9BACT|nr:MFS transporter [Polyangium jinanense]MDC3958701.1 MFS transporter [Polyangium jinanense]MDC3985318.1 MFS transporter [Polyangium jinanense]
MNQGPGASSTSLPIERGEPSALVEDARTRRGRWTAWVLTWVSYATYYLGRKGISVAKAPIMESLGKDVLRNVETAYLAAYMVGQYVNGMLGDRVGARRLVGVGMLVSAGACLAFGASSVGIAFLVAFLVNGFAQSSGWPGNAKAMAEWTTPENRGRVMGVWATCYQAGGIIATWFATFMLSLYGWRACFWGPAVGVALVGVLVLLFLKPGPRAVAVVPGRDVTTIVDFGKMDEASIRALQREERNRVLRSPTVWFYGASYFGMKLIRYSILFWLPFYLTTALHYSKTGAGYMSISFEVGGVLGTITMGAMSDRYRHISRSVFAAAWLVLLAGAIFLYAQLGATGTVANFVMMALVGALLFGPDSLISGAAAQDAGGAYAAATALGVVNGVGSIGAILQEYVTRGVSERYGWDKLFYVFVALAVFSAVCLIPTFRPRKA